MTTKKAEVKESKKTLGVCCPIFDPQKWDNKTFHWSEKMFVKASVPALFHVPFMPLIGKNITKMMKKAEKEHKLSSVRTDILLLFMDPHPFKSEMYLSVTDEIPELENVELTGTFRCQVFEGDFHDVAKNIKAMKAVMELNGQKVKHFYVQYAYCPDCAKEAGTNYLALFAELEEKTN